MTDPRLRRVLLVGFMGSGKTSVGKCVAAGLSWRFVDFDDAIEAAVGISVAQIFEDRGEPYFRALEERLTYPLLLENEVVLGSGGGWAANAGRVSSVPEGTATFWLQVSASEAIRRTSGELGKRPLLQHTTALSEASALLSARVGFYQDAHWTVDTEHLPIEDVSAQVLEILAHEYGEFHQE